MLLMVGDGMSMRKRMMMLGIGKPASPRAAPQPSRPAEKTADDAVLPSLESGVKILLGRIQTWSTLSGDGTGEEVALGGYRPCVVVLVAGGGRSFEREEGGGEEIRLGELVGRES